MLFKFPSLDLLYLILLSKLETPITLSLFGNLYLRCRGLVHGIYLSNNQVFNQIKHAKTDKNILFKGEQPKLKC
jgi:hypothetical protein